MSELLLPGAVRHGSRRAGNRRAANARRPASVNDCQKVGRQPYENAGLRPWRIEMASSKLPLHLAAGTLALGLAIAAPAAAPPQPQPGPPSPSTTPLTCPHPNPPAA